MTASATTSGSATIKQARRAVSGEALLVTYACYVWRQAEVAMKTASIVGVVLIVLGVIALVYGGISYTRQEKILDLGPIEATTETRETIPLPPILGALALAGGIVLLVVGARRAG